MEEILVPSTIKLEKEEGNEAVFVVEPCYPGYGHTLGNALRRVLLSSLTGGAVTAVKIKGVSHEFETIEHVSEDVVELLLNLKKLRLKMHSDASVVLKLHSKGMGDITAADIEDNSDVEVVNKDLFLATKTHKDANIEMEIHVEKGRGYSPVEQREEKELEVDMILVDAVFTPIERVSYEISNIRVGQRTDFDQLRINIQTDGTISPRQALTESAELLVNHFQFITGAESAKKEEEIEVVEEKEEEGPENELYSKIVQELNLSTRTSNALDKAKIRTVGDLVERAESELLSLEGFGETALNEIKTAIAKLDLTLKEEE